MMPVPHLRVVIVVLAIFKAQIEARSELKNFVFNTNALGAYSFEYQISDGSYRKEDGGYKSQSDNFGVRGEYGYIDPMGRSHSVRYIADINGFQPQYYSDDSRFNDRRII